MYFIMSGYVAKNQIEKVKYRTNYKSEQYQIIIATVERMCFPDDHVQKLINCLPRGGLTTVNNRCLPIFLTAEESNQIDTMGIPHKIDVTDKVDQLTTKHEVISIFNKLSRNLKLFFCQK